MGDAVSQEDAVYAVLCDITGLDRAEIKPEQDLVADLGIDSPNALRLLVDLEDKLGIEISDEEAAAMDTVGDILTNISAR